MFKKRFFNFFAFHIFCYLLLSFVFHPHQNIYLSKLKHTLVDRISKLLTTEKTKTRKLCKEKLKKKRKQTSQKIETRKKNKNNKKNRTFMYGKEKGYKI